MRIKRNILVPAGVTLFFLLLGCAPRGVYVEGFDFSSYTRIGILEFSSAFYPQSGPVVRDEFTRQLMKKDVRLMRLDVPGDDTAGVLEAARGYDLHGILSGTVTLYEPEARERVYFKDSEDNIVSEVFVTEARLGVSARLTDASTGQIMWADTYSYSSYTMENAVSAVVGTLVRRLQRASR